MSRVMQTSLLAALAFVLLTGAAAVPAGVAPSWAHSYSISGHCYCLDNHADAVGNSMVNGPDGHSISANKACDMVGKGPIALEGERRVYYNSLQCGHAPYYSDCHGRMDNGPNGCNEMGPGYYYQKGFNAQFTPVVDPKAPISR